VDAQAPGILQLQARRSCIFGTVADSTRLCLQGAWGHALPSLPGPVSMQCHHWYIPTSTHSVKNTQNSGYFPISWFRKYNLQKVYKNSVKNLWNWYFFNWREWQLQCSQGQGCHSMGHITNSALFQSLHVYSVLLAFYSFCEIFRMICLFQDTETWYNLDHRCDNRIIQPLSLLFHELSWLAAAANKGCHKIKWNISFSFFVPYTSHSCGKLMYLYSTYTSSQKECATWTHFTAMTEANFRNHDWANICIKNVMFYSFYAPSCIIMIFV